MTYQVKAEKLIGRPASEVFNALKDGLLFMNCGADSGSMQIDFRVGGKYHINFKNKTLANFGEFLEIIPNKKIVFSWCQTFGADQKPDTQVVIELFEDGSKTRLVLNHTGFKDQATRDNHQMGWDGGINDFTAQVENGQLRMLRAYPASAEKIFEICKNQERFLSLMSEAFRDSVNFKVGPNKKIELSGLGGTATLAFNSKEDGSSFIEIIHQGLHSLAEQKAHRAGWESFTKKMTEIL
ncbi:MAG TPA: SRPBCC domain-containing protein [Bdellovibrio sp.]|uniref:SRPBCC family protein n=1 Tax=Bdellovibrio sp. TaxID=28201 RepID=UPI002F1E672C